MQLTKINRWLRWIGLVLVVQTGDAGEPTVLRLMRASKYRPIWRHVCTSGLATIDGCGECLRLGHDGSP